MKLTIVITALIAALFMAASTLTKETLPDNVPDCDEDYYTNGGRVDGKKGVSKDRMIGCMKNAGGEYAWFEIMTREVR